MYKSLGVSFWTSFRTEFPTNGISEVISYKTLYVITSEMVLQRWFRKQFRMELPLKLNESSMVLPPKKYIMEDLRGQFGGNNIRNFVCNYLWHNLRNDGGNYIWNHPQSVISEVIMYEISYDMYEMMSEMILTSFRLNSLFANKICWSFGPSFPMFSYQKIWRLMIWNWENGNILIFLWYLKNLYWHCSGSIQ